MSGKFCRMFVDMSGKVFLGMSASQQFWGEILMFSLPVRANYTVPPPQTRSGPYAHVHTLPNFYLKLSRARCRIDALCA